jgi:glycosyltransferase involved in cell wall biosynthesis
MIHALALTDVDRPALSEHRVALPARAVTMRADELAVSVETTDRLAAVMQSHGSNQVATIHIPNGITLLIVSQPVGPAAANAILWLRRHRPDVAVVVDVSHHPGRDVEFDRLTRACALANGVTASCPPLAETFGYLREHTFTIRDAVPESMLHQPSRALTRRSSADIGDRIIGWSGDARRSSDDLRAMCGALASVVGVDRTEGRSVRFRNVGPLDDLAKTLMLNPRDVEASGRLSSQLHRIALGEVDIAVVPVNDESNFATRSGLHALEFAAAGVPVIASSTFEHRWLRDSGVPLWLVKQTSREWTRALHSLLALDDDELRDLAAAHRESVRSHTIEARAREWAHAWRSVVSVRLEETV